MTSTKLRKFFYISAFLYLAYRAKADILAWGVERVVLIPTPPKRKSDQRNERNGKDPVLLSEEEVASHECLEDEDAPDDPNESYWPCLTMGLVGFVEN
jgi:hypothetical protein